MFCSSDPSLRALRPRPASGLGPLGLQLSTFLASLREKHVRSSSEAEVAIVKHRDSKPALDLDLGMVLWTPRQEEEPT